MHIKHLLVSAIVLAGLGMMGLMAMSFKDEYKIPGGNRFENAPSNEILGATSDGSSVTNPLEAKTERTWDYEPIVVLELFTSQGCSSCPAADALLDKVKNAHPDQVFALSYHVDYWNYIGWEDPFSQPRFTEKQSKYNLKLKSRSNYTPEIVVNGQAHFVGSDKAQLQAAIAKYSAIETPHKLSLGDVSTDGRNVRFTYELVGPMEGAKLRAVLVLDQQTTQVKRGENRNRTLVNSNIVVAEKSIDIISPDLNETVEEENVEHEPIERDRGNANIVEREFTIGRRSKSESTKGMSSKGKSFITIPDIVFPDDDISLILLAENDRLDITGAAKIGIER